MDRAALCLAKLSLINLLDIKLFTALATEAERRISEFNAQELANMAWVFGKMNLLDKQLFALLAK